MSVFSISAYFFFFFSCHPVSAFILSAYWRPVLLLSCTFPAKIRLDEDILKTSWRRLSSSSLADFLIKTNIFALLIRLQKTSSSRPIYSSWSYVFKTSSRRLQDIFKTSSRCFENVFKTSSRHLQDVFKTYYQVKVFLVTQFQDVFETYSKRFWDVLLRWLSTGGLPRSHFWEIYGQCTKLPRVIKFSQVLIFYFITPFSGYTL